MAGPHRSRAGPPALLFGYASLSESEIEAGVAQWRRLLAGHPFPARSRRTDGMGGADARGRAAVKADSGRRLRARFETRWIRWTIVAGVIACARIPSQTRGGRSRCSRRARLRRQQPPKCRVGRACGTAVKPRCLRAVSPARSRRRRSSGRRRRHPQSFAALGQVVLEADVPALDVLAICQPPVISCVRRRRRRARLGRAAQTALAS